MKFVLSAFLLAQFAGFGAFAAPKKRVVASMNSVKCEAIAKERAREILQKEDAGSGLNEKVPVQFLPLNNGGIYVVSGWIQKSFDWQVVLVMSASCEVQGAVLN